MKKTLSFIATLLMCVGLYGQFPNMTENITDSIFLINEFDWTTAHGAMDPASPYYDEVSSGFDDRGWMSPVRLQAPEPSCAMYSAISVSEGLLNLYYNGHYDYDFSEQMGMDMSEVANNPRLMTFPHQVKIIYDRYVYMILYHGLIDILTEILGQSLH